MRVSRRDGQVSVRVADDGVGIDAEATAGLFTRFSHGVDHTGSRRQPYGIGLALVAKSLRHTMAISPWSPPPGTARRSR